LTGPTVVDGATHDAVIWCALALTEAKVGAAGPPGATGGEVTETKVPSMKFAPTAVQWVRSLQLIAEVMRSPVSMEPKYIGSDQAPET
jgi:hypothetical protein